jgi:RNA polymerase sigma factor (sigma-70 family)
MGVGTVAALEALYGDRYSEFLRVASAIAGDEGRGADAVQDAFARALISLRAFRGDAPLEAWVWRIVVNAARSVRSKEQRASAEMPVPASSDNYNPDESEVRRRIASLPDRQRTAIFLRYFADLDYRTIAVVLGVEVGTVSATLSAAHDALRRNLEEVQR